MPFLGPALPLRRNKETGYKLINNYRDLVKQNFKNLLFTIPGERMMDPNFGIGLLAFLFEQDTPFLYDKIISNIKKQIKKYLPYIEVKNVIFNSTATDVNMDQNTLSIVVEYRIVPLEITDVIKITNTID